MVAETLRAALDDLAMAVPDWVRAAAQPAWFERHGRRVEDRRLPESQEKREAPALEIGADGFVLLEALDGPDAPKAAREVAMVQALRDVWRAHHAREEDGRPRWRTVAELPAAGERLQPPHGPEMRCSAKRRMEWPGHKGHATETCDEDAARLAAHVKTCPAMQQDMTSTAQTSGFATAGIRDRLAAKGLPAERFVGSACIDAGLLVESRRNHGVSLEGPVRGVANQHARAKGCGQRRFAIGWEREHAACPRGKAPVTWRAGRADADVPRIQAMFSRTGCGACVDRALCTPSRDARRSLRFRPRAPSARR